MPPDAPVPPRRPQGRSVKLHNMTAVRALTADRRKDAYRSAKGSASALGIAGGLPVVVEFGLRAVFAVPLAELAAPAPAPVVDFTGLENDSGLRRSAGGYSSSIP